MGNRCKLRESKDNYARLARCRHPGTEPKANQLDVCIFPVQAGAPKQVYVGAFMGRELQLPYNYSEAYSSCLVLHQ
jgi:hypothetical protein